TVPVSLFFAISGTVALVKNRLVKPVHSWNAPYLMLVNLLGRMTVARRSQLVNVSLRISVIPVSSRLILVRLEQSQNAPLPMVPTLFGGVMLFRLEHPVNAPVSMVVKPLGRVMLSRLVHPK